MLKVSISLRRCRDHGEEEQECRQLLVFNEFPVQTEAKDGQVPVLQHGT
jgi:hypothetical protein